MPQPRSVYYINKKELIDLLQKLPDNALPMTHIVVEFDTNLPNIEEVPIVKIALGETFSVQRIEPGVFELHTHVTKQGGASLKVHRNPR